MKLLYEFSTDDINNIKNAISKAELNTSGEIRVHIDEFCQYDVMQRATEVFFKLKMDKKTKLHNGILLYLAIKSKKFAIIGDYGINNVIENNYWQQLKDEALIYFKKGLYVEGLVDSIDKVGQKLKEHFPHKKNDINEIPDEISYENHYEK